MRRRTSPSLAPSRSLVLSLSLSLGLAAALLAGCSDPTAPTSDPAEPASTAASGQPLDVSSAGWTRIEGFPLSNRTDPLMVEVEGELYVLGGNTGFVCPPYADCVGPSPEDLARDGAAYDPRTGAWRTIADLPRGTWLASYGTEPLVVAGLVLLPRSVERAGVWGTQWLSYDPEVDAWEPVAALDSLQVDASKVATDGETLWVLDGRRVLTLDPRTGEQAQIGRYPVAGSLRSVRLLPGPSGPAVSGWVPGAAADEPTLAAVDVMAGAGRGATWRRLETEMYGEITHFTGTEFVGLEWGSADGGATNNWGRHYDAGGRVLARTGDWESLEIPDPPRPREIGPESAGDGWSAQAAAGAKLAVQGFTRDLASGGGWQAYAVPAGANVDTQVSAAWVGDWLVVVGGVDLEGAGYREPAATEVWAYRPSSD